MAVYQRHQHIQLGVVLRSVYRLDQLIQRKVIDMIHIARSQGHRSQARWQRLSRNNHDMRRTPFSIADKVQAFGADILRPVAANRPFTGDAGVEYQIGLIPGSQRTIMAKNVRITDNRLMCVNFLIGHRITRDDNIRRDEIIAPKAALNCGLSETAA